MRFMSLPHFDMVQPCIGRMPPDRPRALLSVSSASLPGNLSDVEIRRTSQLSAERHLPACSCSRCAVSERKPYPSDLSDARWSLIEPTLTAWRNARLNRRPTVSRPRSSYVMHSTQSSTSTARESPGNTFRTTSPAMAPSTPTTRPGATRESSPSSTTT